MKNLGMSSPQLPTSGSASGNSTSLRQADYAAERAQVLFGSYRKGDANDPDTYVAAVAAILADYPGETIRYVTDPRTGLASKSVYMPNPAEVKRACEEHYGPMRRAMEREAAERRQMQERQTLAITDDRPRKTYEQMAEECRAAGLNIGPKPEKVKPIDSFLQEHGVSREQFDALPDLPKDIGVPRHT